MSFEIKFGTNDENFVCLPLNGFLKKCDEDLIRSVEALEGYIDAHFDDFPSEMIVKLLAKSDTEVIVNGLEGRADSEVEDIMSACCRRLGPDGADNVKGLVDIIGIDELLRQLNAYLEKDITSDAWQDIRRVFGL